MFISYTSISFQPSSCFCKLHRNLHWKQRLSHLWNIYSSTIARSWVSWLNITSYDRPPNRALSQCALVACVTENGSCIGDKKRVKNCKFRHTFAAQLWCKLEEFLENQKAKICTKVAEVYPEDTEGLLHAYTACAHFLPCMRMREGVKQSVFSVRLSVCPSVRLVKNFEIWI